MLQLLRSSLKGRATTIVFMVLFIFVVLFDPVEVGGLKVCNFNDIG